MVGENDVLDALTGIVGPDGRSAVSRSNGIAGLTIRSDKVYLALSGNPRLAQAMETMRAEAEGAIRALPGVAAAVVSLTAERSPGETPRPGAQPPRDGQAHAGQAHAGHAHGPAGAAGPGAPRPHGLPRRARLGAGPGSDLPPVALDDRLKELHFGDWEGRTWDDLERHEPAAMAARRGATWSFVPPNGESYAMLLDRLDPWLAELAEDAVVVAHGGVAKVLMHRAAALGVARAVEARVHQGRVLVFEAGAAHWV